MSTQLDARDCQKHQLAQMPYRPAAFKLMANAERVFRCVWCLSLLANNLLHSVFTAGPAVEVVVAGVFLTRNRTYLVTLLIT